jgi:hypothetical protein
MSFLFILFLHCLVCTIFSFLCLLCTTDPPSRTHTHTYSTADHKEFSTTTDGTGSLSSGGSSGSGSSGSGSGSKASDRDEDRDRDRDKDRHAITDEEMKEENLVSLCAEYIFDLFDANMMEDYHTISEFESRALDAFPNYLSEEISFAQEGLHKEFLVLFEKLIGGFLMQNGSTTERFYNQGKQCACDVHVMCM